MNPPNEDDMTAAPNNEATVPGATSDLAVASSSLHLGHASNRRGINTTADADMDAAPAINNEAAATATGATLKPPYTMTTIKADAREKGALFLIESVRNVAANLKEEEENANDARERHGKYVRVGSKSAALHHFLRSREEQRAQKQGEEGAVMDETGEQQKGEDLRDAKADFTNGGGEDSTPKPKLVDDGEELSCPNHANSTMVDVGQHLHEDKTSPPAAAMSGSGVEIIIEDGDGLLIPPAMSAIPFDGDPRKHNANRTAASPYVKKSAKARPAIMLDNTGPAPPLVEMEFIDSKKLEPIVARPPRPISIADVGDPEYALKKGQPPRRQVVREDPLVIPPSEEMENEVVQIHTNRRGGRAEEFMVNANVASSNPHVHRDEDEEANIQHSKPEDTLARPDLERDETFRVPEAVLVEEVDDEVYVGTPVEPHRPWWKLKRVWIVLGSVTSTAVAISLGSALPSNNSSPVMFTNAPSRSFGPSNSPSITTFPSVEPTETPSVSIKPTTSFPPSECVSKISSKMQKIDLPLDDPQFPRVAVDGKNAVVVVQDGDMCENNPAYVIFRSLTAIGGWLHVDTFVIDYLGDQDYYSVALSGKTAFVGFEFAESEYDNDWAGVVLVFEQNQFGRWEKVDKPFIHVSAVSHHRFGYHVGIDGDLAFVSDWSNVYMFHQRSNGKWVEFDMVHKSGSYHSISGYIIAIEDVRAGHIQLYKNKPDLDEALSIQDPIPTGYVHSMDLSNEYLVYWDGDEEDAFVFVYRKEETNQTFAFHQQLNISDPWGYGLVLDSDILVTWGTNSTHIFSEQYGKWEEVITLDQSYDYYALSGRQLFATTSTEVHAFGIQDCVQAMRTQTPSSSLMPSTSPSSPPSIFPSSSVSPSTSPTACYWTTITIDYDDKLKETHWYLYRAVDAGSEMVRTHYASEGDTSYSESFCLKEGEYKFSIYDSYSFDGICCDHGEGSYTVIVDGALIVEGGEFGLAQGTDFSLPFVPGTNVTTQF